VASVVLTDNDQFSTTRIAARRETIFLRGKVALPICGNESLNLLAIISTWRAGL
jgi:hypothetical protein